VSHINEVFFIELDKDGREVARYSQEQWAARETNKRLDAIEERLVSIEALLRKSTEST
jgi:hypothetical protein